MNRRTRRIIGRSILTLAVFFLVVAGLLAWTFLGRSSVVDGAEFGSVRIVKDGIVSVGIFPTDDKQVALVDAGNDKTGKAILAELARRGLGPDNVTTILLTHGHPDHTAAIALFPRAQVMALDQEVGLVEGTAGAHGPLTMLMPVRPTGIKVARALHDDETILLGNVAVHVFAVPGHTAGSAAYLVDGVLFLGDAADIALDHSLDIAPWIFSDSQSQDRESLTNLNRRLLPIANQIRAIDCAHSGMMVRGLEPLMLLTRG
jgi:glyoxylase-like metal-dependent hydrolase (beta-lactamase superfamily II)